MRNKDVTATEEGMPAAVPLSTGTPLAELDTPALLIDLDRMERNIAAMAEDARRSGKNLRPHAKAHKIPSLATLQMQAGAIGITCQKLGEAEIMAAAGLSDILVTFPIVGSVKIQRLLHLARHIHVTTVIDSLEAAGALSAAAEAEHLVLDALLEVDIGYRRCGALPDRAAEIGPAIVRDCPGLRFGGIMAYEGHLYNLQGAAAVFAAATSAYDTMGAVAGRLREQGIDVPIVSVGASAGARAAFQHPAITELRAGSYIFNDLAQVSMGGATLDQCALSVLATVVSAQSPDRAVIDAGAKALTYVTVPGFPGYGRIVEHPDAVIDRLADEHGMITVPPGAQPLRIGERIRIIPNAESVVVNEFTDVVGIRDERVERVWPIAARGRMQ